MESKDQENKEKSINTHSQDTENQDHSCFYCGRLAKPFEGVAICPTCL